MGGDLTSPGYGAYGLIKVGKVRISLTPGPFAGPGFRQELKLREGVMEVSAGVGGEKSKLLLWVDAKRPVIHVETSGAAARMKVSFESYRTAPGPYLTNTDTVVPGRKDRVTWYYVNPNRDIPPLIHRTIGASVSGEGLAATSPTVLESAAPAKSFHVAVHVLTAQCPEPAQWLARLDQQIAATNATPLEQARREHRDWWREFWGRSWVFVKGDASAERVTQGYILQRFKNACSSRGEFPIKFNGSIFNVDDPHDQVSKDKQGVVTRMPITADFRSWGHQYWFQNTRPMYWPMMMSGDFDLMQPLFRMYRAMLPGNASQVKEYYHHDGAYFRETGPFWGGLEKITPESPGNYTRHYYTPILELSAMMLDYFAYTGDRGFVKDTLLPMADAGVTFFDKHFARDPQGRLVIQPSNAIEMFWKVRNPLPNIAGLHYVLQGLLALPSDLTTAADRQRWQRILASVPPVPTGERDGKTQLLPFEDGQNAPRHNSENPELLPSIRSGLRSRQARPRSRPRRLRRPQIQNRRLLVAGCHAGCPARRCGNGAEIRHRASHPQGQAHAFPRVLGQRTRLCAG